MKKEGARNSDVEQSKLRKLRGSLENVATYATFRVWLSVLSKRKPFPIKYQPGIDFYIRYENVFFFDAVYIVASWRPLFLLEICVSLKHL